MANSDMTREAQKIWKAIQPMVRKEARDAAQSAVRAKKMTVVTPPNGQTVGVAEPFGETLNLPYSSALPSLSPGDAVWVQWFYDNASTMMVICKGDGQTFGADNPLSVAQGGTGASQSPELLVNLGSADPAPILQPEPRPGVTGILSVVNGGTGATTEKEALTRLGALPVSGGTMIGKQLIQDGYLEITDYMYPFLWLRPIYGNVKNVGRLESGYDGTISIQAWEDSSGQNRRIFRLSNAAETEDIANALTLDDVRAGLMVGKYTVLTTAAPVGIANGGAGIENPGRCRITSGGSTTIVAGETNLATYHFTTYGMFMLCAKVRFTRWSTSTGDMHVQVTMASSSTSTDVAGSAHATMYSNMDSVDVTLTLPRIITEENEAVNLSVSLNNESGIVRVDSYSFESYYMSATTQVEQAAT